MPVESLRRRLGNTDIEISAVGLGCWPMAGMSGVSVDDDESLAALTACRDAGINFLDTAYCYGANGESDELIAKLLRQQNRDEFVIATKAGVHWNDDGTRGKDASPATLKRQLELSLKRLGTDYVDLFYLHAPDRNVPVAESAAAYRELLDRGLTRSVGASNLDVSQLEEFHRECPIVACQPPYNMLQREIEADILPWCQKHGVSAVTYWTLMKGLLSGKYPREHQFAEKDTRRGYEVFQGEQWEQNQNVVDVLRGISQELDRPISEIVVNWTIHQPGITVALCGARSPNQIIETARAMSWKLSPLHLQKIELALEKRLAALPSDPKLA